METSPYEYERLALRSGFNSALGHFRTVSALMGDFEEGLNLADLLNDLLSEKEIADNQIQPVIHAFLTDKYSYSYTSLNLEESFRDMAGLCREVSQWNGVDVLICYVHPELGCLAVNPKNPESADLIDEYRKNELIVLYAGFFADEGDGRLAEKALTALRSYLNMKKRKVPEELKKGPFSRQPLPWREEEEAANDGSEEKPEKNGAAESVRRMTPFYSVPVTNELFHNGNVEAWKRIIQSYTTKYPSLEVYIFYDGERIHNIASLFKWGKVKHGSAILFAVAGEGIKDIPKLQRYLRQGASPQFEAFLRLPVNKIHNLF